MKELDKGVCWSLENRKLALAVDEDGLGSFYIADDEKVIILGSENINNILYRICTLLFFEHEREYVSYKRKEVFKIIDFLDTHITLLGGGNNGNVDEWIFVDETGNEILTLDLRKYDYRWIADIIYLKDKVGIKDNSFIMEKDGTYIKFTNIFKDRVYVYIGNYSEEIVLGEVFLGNVIRDLYINLCIQKEKMFKGLASGPSKWLTAIECPISILCLAKNKEGIYDLICGARQYNKPDINIMRMTEEDVISMIYGFIGLVCDK